MNDTVIHQIVILSQGGASIRRIAQGLHISRRTVRRVLEQHQQARTVGPPRDAPGSAPQRGSQLDAFDAAIRDLLARYPDITVQRVHEELRRLGYQGGYTILSQRVRTLRPRPLVAPVQRFETMMGQQAQMDYSTYDLDFTVEGRRRVHAFSYVLGYSRRQYLHFVESQDFATTIREHIRAFEHLGGVAATCLYDNMKVVVTGYDGDEPVYNPRFLGFAAHYGFRPVACRPRRPQTKGKVERKFGHVDSNLLNGRSFRSLEHLNETTVWWLTEVADVRVHRQTRARPLDRHAEERPFLLALPERPFDCSEVVYRTVDAEGFVVYRQNFYSAPWRLIGQALAVRVGDNEVTIYDRSFVATGVHRLFPRGTMGQRSRLKEHEPPRDAQQRSEQLTQRFAEFGPAGTRFLEGLLAESRYGKNQAERVLSLVAAYPHGDVVAALERTVRYGAFSLAAIQRVLSVQAQPRGIWETLAREQPPSLPPWLDSEPVSPRPTSEYQALLGEEPCHVEATEPEETISPEGPEPCDQGGDPPQPA
jgi:transposase